MKSLGLALVAVGTAAIAQPVLDLPKYRTGLAGDVSRVLVLGTPHLSQLPSPWRREHLAPLIDRLAAWRPTMITIENVSGPDCAYLGANRELTGNAHSDYCWDPAPAAAATGLDTHQATLAIAKTLRAWPAAPGPADRRRLASLFLAAGDRASAQVQWLRLPEGERRAGDGLNAALVTILERRGAKPNESIEIAAVLAARLGHERVYPTDDHSSDAAIGMLPPAYGETVAAAWKAQLPSKWRDEYETRTKSLADSRATLDFYRFLNSPRSQRAAIESDFVANARTPSLGQYGRQYLGWWETRNLRMVANIRAAMTPRPGARVLAIVGSSHKPYFEAYLAQMHDVVVESTDPVLR